MTTPAEVERLLETYCLAISRSETLLLASCFHSSSPNGPAIVQELSRLAEAHRFECRQLRFHLVGHDEDFRYARSLQRTRSVADDPRFRNNTVDALYAIAAEDNQPKIWTSLILNLRFE